MAEAPHCDSTEFTMSADPNAPLNPVPMTPDQLLAELQRENERLRRQVEDARHERDNCRDR